MSSPIDRIRDGITSGDWHAVCDGFAMLTGQKLEPPKQEESEKVVINIPDTFWDSNAFWTGLGERIETVVRERLASVLVSAEATTPADDDDDDEDEEEEENDDEDDDDDTSEAPQPEPADAVSARAREVRDAATSGKAPAAVSPPHRETDYSKFHVQQGQVRSEKGRSCKVVPFEPGMTNNWKDDRSIAADSVKDSKRLSKKKKPEPRRPPVRTVTVQCCKCNKNEEVNPLFAPKSFDRGDTSSYVCNDCIRRNRR